MAEDRATISLAELRHPKPQNEIPGGFARSTLYPSVEGDAHIVPDNPEHGPGGVDDEDSGE
jgi:hypothetical protein